MLSRIPLRRKMAKINIKTFYQCKKVIGLLYNLESGKKGLKKFSLQKFHKLSALSIPFRQEIPYFLQDLILHWP